MSAKIRPARKKDYPAIEKILKDLDLFYASLLPEDFWVAEEDKKIIGTVQLKEYKDFFFLGSLGVAIDQQHKGVAAALMREVLKAATKDTYLYTIIPEFFAKFGFQITDPLPDLPSKDRYECEYCHPERCVTMKRLKTAQLK